MSIFTSVYFVNFSHLIFGISCNVYERVLGCKEERESLVRVRGIEEQEKTDQGPGADLTSHDE